MKIYYACLNALLLIMIAASSANAQVNFVDNNDDHLSGATASNEKAIANFQKTFSEATEVKWQNTKTGSRVCFMQRESKCTVDYSHRGKWVSTIKRTLGEYASAPTRKLIQQFYPGYHVMYETYVENWQGAVVLAKIENETMCKTIRIVNDQYDEIEEFKKI